MNRAYTVHIRSLFHCFCHKGRYQLVKAVHETTMKKQVSGRGVLGYTITGLGGPPALPTMTFSTSPRKLVVCHPDFLSPSAVFLSLDQKRGHFFP